MDDALASGLWRWGERGAPVGKRYQRRERAQGQ